MNCRFHCCACDAHFASLSAFDAHRRSEDDERVCADPETVDKIKLLGEASCLTGPTRLDGVKVWGLQLTEAAERRLASMARAPATAAGSAD